MKLNFKEYLSKNREALESKTAKVGGYSFLLSIVVLAIVIAVNVLMNALPTTWTQFDISAAQLYSLTSNTKVVVNNLNQDITIYRICQAGKEDEVVERLLNVYEDMSSHITVVRKDPDAYPTFAAQYTDGTVVNNSLVVECGDRYRYIDYNSMYPQDTTNYSTTGSASYSFDGEALVTTAINYVTTEDCPRVYLLTGHGEQALSDTATTSIQRQNVDTEELSLLNIDQIPEDADAIILNGPTSDLAKEEVEMLSSFVENGGHLLVLEGPQESDHLTNLDSLLEAYGISVADGVVVESDRDYYAFSAPFFLLAQLNQSDITNPLIEAGSKVIVPIAEGLVIDSEKAPSNATVKTLLSTSDTAFSKIDGYSISTYEKEENDVDGPFGLAVSIENSDNDGKVVWIGSSYMLSDEYNSYSSGANVDFVMNSLSWMIGETEPIAIRAKSLNYNYLTISDSQARTIKISLIGVLPLCYLLYGLSEVLRRRKVN